MDDKQRKYIMEKIDTLVALTEYEPLATKCVSYGLLSDTMKHNIEYGSQQRTGDNSKKHRRLFEKITHRGPDAYQTLKKILSDLGNDKALQILNSPQDEEESDISYSVHQDRNHPPITSKIQVPPVDGNGKIRLTEFSGRVDETDLEKKLIVVKSGYIKTDEFLGTYKMQSKDIRGVLFLVNIINIVNEDPREGAEKDSNSLKNIFLQLGFKIFEHNDCTQLEFFELLKQCLNHDYTKKTECFVLVLMSHGNIDNQQTELVQFSDGSIAYVKDIVKHFNNQECTNLVDKPKVLIFPFCRGSEPDKGIAKKIQMDAANAQISRIVPTLSHILICYAVPIGFQSHRDRDEGSWYIQELCKVIAERAHDKDFIRLLDALDQRVSKRRSESNTLQTASYLNIGFNKLLYLNPGM